MAKKKRRPQPARSSARGRPDQKADDEVLAKAPVMLQAPRGMRIYAALFGIAFLVVVVLNAVAARKSALSTIPLILVCLGAVVCLRIFRTALVADQRGVMIRNYFRTYRLRWSDIADFRLDPPATRLEGWELSVVTASGKEIRLDALRQPFVRNVDNNRPKLEGARKQLLAWLR